MDTPLCDVLDAPAVVMEIGLGAATGGPFPISESLDSLYLGSGDPVCPATNDPFLADAVVAILNTSGQEFPDVWYVADSATALSNSDGLVGEGAGPATLLTFKIDAVGDNQPLVYESLHENGIWEPGEVWYFVIQDFVSAAGAPPAALGSLGLNSVPGISSSASIVTTPIVSSEVTTLADSGPGSLRQVIADVPAGTTVTFAANLNGQTITLDGTQLLIAKDLTIDASAQADGMVVSANHLSRVFEIAAGTTVAMSKLTITGGDSNSIGGGIRNAGTLSLATCSIVGNQANNSGGGLFNTASTGNIFFINGTVANNSAVGFGGGISTSGGALEDLANGIELRNVTVAGNQTMPNGSGQAFGGGIHQQLSFVRLIHVTVTDNTVLDNTGLGGGGGIYRTSGDLHLEHSIVAGNHASTAAEQDLRAAVTTHAGVNLIGHPTGASGLGVPGTNYRVAAHGLAPLGTYGGFTQTMPPLPGSPAIEGGVILTTTPPTDQRGNLRPAGPRPDIGAVEAFPFSTLLLVDSDNDGIDDRIEPAYPQLTVGTDDSALDSDGDGSPDGEELANMTDPLDGSDKFRTMAFAPAAGFNIVSQRVFRITLATFPGLGYDFESSATLNGFEVIPDSSFIATGFITTVDVTLPPGRQFLRAARRNSFL
ncbi:MAG: thrombospondin type 3 repeat-containing protein [Akkermansiaceae bacterium]|nr:thrombospondin type 3 repeat-containing protein [Akkermansiaceae bacterium]